MSGVLLAFSQRAFNFHALAEQRKRPQLVTISYSHYAEAARWCLDLDGRTYDEHGYSGGQHVLPVLGARVPLGGGPTFFSTSSSINGVKEPSPTSVPVLVFPSGAVLRDSWEIAASTSLTPIEEDLRVLLDEELGPTLRTLAYCYLFKPGVLPLFHRLCTDGRPLAFQLFWRLGFGAYLVGYMKSLFATDDPATLPSCEKKARKLFARLSEVLDSRGASPFLGGESPGVADVFLASLAAVVVNPPEYGGADRSLANIVGEQEKLDPAYAAHVESFRQTVLGKFTLSLYATRRKSVGKVTASTAPLDGAG